MGGITDTGRSIYLADDRISSVGRIVDICAGRSAGKGEIKGMNYKSRVLC